MLYIVAIYHCMRFQRKLMNQMWENGKTPNFGVEIWAPKFFLWILPALYNRHCYKLSLYATSMKNNQPILKKWQKNLVSGPILVYLTQIWVTNIFFKNICLSQLLDMVSYHHVQNQKKLMVQSWENLVTNGRMDRPTDGQERLHMTLPN